MSNKSERFEYTDAELKFIEEMDEPIGTMIQGYTNGNKRLSKADLRAAAEDGLLRAIRNYNPDNPKKASLSTYAYYVIKDYINKEAKREYNLFNGLFYQSINSGNKQESDNQHVSDRIYYKTTKSKACPEELELVSEEICQAQLKGLLNITPDNPDIPVLKDYLVYGCKKTDIKRKYPEVKLEKVLQRYLRQFTTVA